MSDSQGFGTLLEMLKRIEADLIAGGRNDEAAEIHRATRFASGSPSEFLGESRLTLERLLQVDPPLPPATEALVRAAVDGITVGFRSVGGE